MFKGTSHNDDLCRMLEEEVEGTANYEKLLSEGNVSSSSANIDR